MDQDESMVTADCISLCREALLASADVCQGTRLTAHLPGGSSWWTLGLNEEWLMEFSCVLQACVAFFSFRRAKLVSFLCLSYVQVLTSWL